MDDDTGAQLKGKEAVEPLTNQSGGVNTVADNVSIGNDVVGRDKIQSADGDIVGRDQYQSSGGTIVHAESGATIIVSTAPLAPAVSPSVLRPRRKRLAVVILAGACAVVVLGSLAALLAPNIGHESLPTVMPPPPLTTPTLSIPIAPTPLPLTVVVRPFADCQINAATLFDDFYSALTQRLSAVHSAANLRRGAASSSDARPTQAAQADEEFNLIIDGQCRTGQVEYRATLSLPESELAELSNINLTWSLVAVDTPSLVLASVVAYYSNEVERAAAWLSESAKYWRGEIAPEERTALEFLLGNALLRHREQATREALDQYDLAAANMPLDMKTQGNWQAKLHNNRGLALIIEDQTKDAEHEFDLATQNQPDDVWILLNRSLVRALNGTTTLALADCRQVDLLTGDAALREGCYAQVYYQVYYYGQESPDYRKVVEFAQQAMKTDPRFGIAYYYAGMASCELGDTASTSAWLEGFLNLSKHPVLIRKANDYLTEIRAGGRCDARSPSPTPSP